MKKRITKSTDKRDKQGVAPILVSGFLTALGIGLFSFTVPLLSMDAKVSGAWLGTGFAGFFLARLVAGPLGGLWADRVGARMPLLVGASTGAFSPLVYFMFPSLASLYLIQFVLGIVSGLIRPVGLAALGNNAPDGAQGRWFAGHVLVFNLAMLAGPLLGGVLFWNRTMEPVLVGVVLCMVLAHLVVFVGIPAGTRSHRRVRGEKEKSDTVCFGALLAAIFGRTFGLGVFITFYPVLLSMKLGVHGLTIGALFTLPGLATCVGLPLGAWMRKRSSVDPVVTGMALSAAGMIVAGVSVELWHFVGAGVVMGLGAALSAAESMRLASSMSRDQGRIFGVTHLVTGLGFVAGPLFGGLIVQGVGNLGVTFVLAGLLGWFCLLAWSPYDGWNRNTVVSMRRWVLSRVVPAGVLLAVMLGVFSLYKSHDGVEHADLYRYTDVAMGTVVNLTLQADSRTAADHAARKAIAFMRVIQKDFDFRSPEGSVGRINRAAGTGWVKPTRRTYDLLQRTLDFSDKSDGAFDPTIGAATTSPLYFALDESLIEAKADLVNYRLVRMDSGRRRVRLEKRGMALDLGGVAKGAIIDATVKLLQGLGIKAGVVEAGGDFYCFGDRDWTIGVRHPRSNEVYASLTVREKGVCGSGDYEQYVAGVRKGKSGRRHHILDPTVMAPADESIGVTVLAGSAEQADILATTLFIMGSETGLSFMDLHYPEASAIWFRPDVTTVTTDNFPQ